MGRFMQYVTQKLHLVWQRVVPLSVALSVLLPLGGCSQNWGWYVVNPTTPAGQRNLKFLIDGLYYTIALSVTAICISIIVGLLIALPDYHQSGCRARLTGSMLKWCGRCRFWC